MTYFIKQTIFLIKKLCEKIKEEGVLTPFIL